jgi:hypothetical protein
VIHSNPYYGVVEILLVILYLYPISIKFVVGDFPKKIYLKLFRPYLIPPSKITYLLLGGFNELRSVLSTASTKFGWVFSTTKRNTS